MSLKKTDFEKLKEVLFIARDVSFSGKGISLKEALDRTLYKEWRQSYDDSHLMEVLSKQSEFLQDWYRYSEDKRTSGGYYLEGNSIGSIDKSEIYFSKNMANLVAKYVVMELDYWAGI